MEADKSITDSVTQTDPELAAAPVNNEVANPKKRQRQEDDADADADADDNNDASDDGDGLTPAEQNERPLSKNQLRKQKRQRLREERREDRKRLRKDKRHERVARRRLEREEKATELAQTLGIDKTEALNKLVADERESKREHAQKSRPVPVAFIIDCDFEKYMRENELISLSSQITRSYSMNKGGLYHAHLLVSSWGGKLKERFETTLNNTQKNWKGASFVEQDFVEAGREAWKIMKGPGGGEPCLALAASAKAEGADAAPAEDQVEFTSDSVVYLSADSSETLDKLEPYTSYVIGGLVDRNREKNLCQQRAVGKGIRTAKLPIGEYMQMASRQVLATNHVVEIMSKWLETGDWGKAFSEVIPKRKGGRLKGEEEGDEGDDGDAEAQQDAHQEEPANGAIEAQA